MFYFFLLTSGEIYNHFKTMSSLDNFSVNFFCTMDDMYGLLTKCEVKMAGYWPSSFFACLWTETKSRAMNSQNKNEANIQPS